MIVGGPNPADRNLISGIPASAGVYLQYNVAANGPGESHRHRRDRVVRDRERHRHLLQLRRPESRSAVPGANEGNVIGGSLSPRVSPAASPSSRATSSGPTRRRPRTSATSAAASRSTRAWRSDHRRPRRPGTGRRQRHRAQRRRRHLQRPGRVPHVGLGRQGHGPRQPLLRQPSRGHRARPRSAAPGRSRRRRHRAQRASERARDHRHRLRPADRRPRRPEQHAVDDLRRRLLREHELRLVSRRCTPQGEELVGSVQATTDASGLVDDRLPAALAARAGSGRVGDRDGSSRQHVGVRADDPAEDRRRVRAPPRAAAPSRFPGSSSRPARRVAVGGVAPSNVVVTPPYTITANMPAFDPGTAHDVVVTNPGGVSGTLRNGYIADFLDVPPANQFHDDVVKLVASQVTVGRRRRPLRHRRSGQAAVDGGLRAQGRARHLLHAAALHASGHLRRRAVPVAFADWIEAMFAEGITGGCGGGNFCPLDTVRRDQMAPFLLKAVHGPAYVPPPCSGIFTDVACPSLFADWIEQLAPENVTTGCGADALLSLQPEHAGTDGDLPRQGPAPPVRRKDSHATHSLDRSRLSPRCRPASRPRRSPSSTRTTPAPARCARRSSTPTGAPGRTRSSSRSRAPASTRSRSRRGSLRSRSRRRSTATRRRARRRTRCPSRRGRTPCSRSRSAARACRSPSTRSA